MVQMGSRRGLKEGFRLGPRGFEKRAQIRQSMFCSTPHVVDLLIVLPVVMEAT